MTSRRRGLRIVRFALLAGGATGAAAAGVFGSLVGLLKAETRLAKRRIPVATDPAPPTDNTTWTADLADPAADPVELAVLGDSTAAGYGVAFPQETPAAQLAMGISAESRRPVHITNVAVVGAESYELAPQLTALGDFRPELAVIMIGANDVTARTKPSDAVPFLADTVTALRELGADVIVCTCPDLGTVRPLAQPLRAFARRLSRRMAREQTIAVVEAGGRTVSLGDLLGPLFMSHREMFSEDQFHPSAAGYAEAARAVLPSALDALGLRTRTRAAGPFTTQRAKPVEKAAAQAAARPGTEVAGAGDAADGDGQLARPARRLPRRFAGRFGSRVRRYATD